MLEMIVGVESEGRVSDEGEGGGQGRVGGTVSSRTLEEERLRMLGTEEGGTGCGGRV